MNRDPQFELVQDSSAAPAVAREESTKERLIWTLGLFFFIVGIRGAFGSSLGRGEVLEAAFLSIIVNFGFPALTRYIERRDSTLPHKTPPPS